MKFYSTKKQRQVANLSEVVFRGIAPNGGLYMPEKFPKLEKSFYDNLSSLSLHDIAFEISKHFFYPEISRESLFTIIKDALNFTIPLIHLHDNIYSLELFHGPTLAFKDVGARFMARVCQKLLEKKEKNNKLIILVATSGDTGGAVANGFYNLPNIEVVILYPKNRVNKIQEKQFTTLGKNITAIEVDGSFDDCQKLVKIAFSDKNLRKKISLSSANSINLARLLPQTFYYFYGISQLKKINSSFSKTVYCVPSGNFGNLTAALFAKKMGLPINQFIAATTINDVVPTYLKTGEFLPKVSITTLANAMDVGNPSNFERILNLFNNNYQLVRKNITGKVYTDKNVLACISDVYSNYKYLLDPHSAIGYLGLKDYLKKDRNTLGIFIQTAHPAKFQLTVEKAINKKIEISKKLKTYLSRSSKKVSLQNNYSGFKDFLMSKYQNLS